MSEPDGLAGSPGRLSRSAVIVLGVGALVLGFVILPVFPFVVMAVVIWWLADDLRRGSVPHPGWLGWVALAVFAVVAIGVGFAVTLFDAHFDCGGTLGGFGEAADARLDTQCRDARSWRVAVAAGVTALICVLGVVAVRRFGSSRSPLAVAAAVVGGMLASVVGLLTVLTTT